MTLTIEAVYENGVLKPNQPLPLKEHERVQITVETLPLDILQAQGILGWKGTGEELAPFALDPEFEYPPDCSSESRINRSQAIPPSPSSAKSLIAS